MIDFICILITNKNETSLLSQLKQKSTRIKRTHHIIYKFVSLLFSSYTDRPIFYSHSLFTAYVNDSLIKHKN